LRVAALRQIGGYNPWFWLDNSDAVLYHQLHRYGKKVFVAGDIRIDHHFSMLDKKARMTTSRYHNVLMAESAFWDLAMNRLAGMERTARLIGRWCKQTIQGDSATFGKETAYALKRRLFYSRKSRIELWKRELLVLQPSMGSLEKVGKILDQPKISVCMATCNGAAFITGQLTSVLEQLGPNDEVVVVDDASEDRTKAVIVALGDPRILLIEHENRHGVVKTFEHAIRAASGDILFLSDQDDLWAPEKVSRVTSVFRDHPDVTLVASGVQTIDESGNKIHDDTYSRPRPFSSGVIQNLISNRFQGSTMAFRSQLIPEILPFPHRHNVLHDAWIGMRNTLSGGTSYYIEDPLLLYRRHSRNASRPLGMFQRILKRLHLVLALIARWYTEGSHTPWSQWTRDHHLAARFEHDQVNRLEMEGISLPIENKQSTSVGGE
jgi:glycosyltransferase involved in cell wall biosynthesis